MCELAVDGMGPVAGHCPECDRLIHVASLPARTPGRAFAFEIDPREIKAYMLRRSIDNDDIAALSFEVSRVSGSLNCGFFSDHCSWGPPRAPFLIFGLGHANFYWIYWTMVPEYDWAEYKRVERGHSAGDHARCSPGRCSDAKRLYATNEDRLFAVALLELLGRRARRVLAADYADTVAASRAELPDYRYLDKSPDAVHHLAAKWRVRDFYSAGRSEPAA
jgi:hypothetical protein